MPETELTTRRKLTPLQRRRKIALMDAGITAADVAREAGCARGMVSQMILDDARSQRIAEVFARMTGRPIEDLFPSAT